MQGLSAEKPEVSFVLFGRSLWALAGALQTGDDSPVFFFAFFSRNIKWLTISIKPAVIG